MNNQFSNGRVLRILAAVAGIVFGALALAPAQEIQVESRFLFVFCTSKDMKARIPATQLEMNMLLSTGLHGELHAGDSVGVWTFGKEVKTGQFPLLRWMPDDAATVAAAINKFIGKQSYWQTNDFRMLMPYLQSVVDGSPRLTILIFCDGESPFAGSLYDTGINPAFMQRSIDSKKAKQPFVIVMRSQHGRYVGCSVNFPPGMVSLPDFPPLPSPPRPSAPADVPAPKPVTPLVIVGTHIETNWDAYRSAVANPARPASTSPSRPDAVASAPANAIVSSGTAGGAVVATNISMTVDRSGKRGMGLLALMAGVLVGGIALAIWLISRSGRGDGGSLISRSMKK